VKELEEEYTALIEKNKREIKSIKEMNSKKVAVSKRFAEEKMCNIEDSANMVYIILLLYYVFNKL